MDIPEGASALESSFVLGEESARLGFDWESVQQVIYKVEEEWQELKGGDGRPPPGQQGGDQGGDG